MVRKSYDEYDKLYDEYRKRSSEINEKARANPDDWELFLECGEELSALADEFDARHDEIDKQAKPLRNLRRLWEKEEGLTWERGSIF